MRGARPSAAAVLLAGLPGLAFAQTPSQADWVAARQTVTTTDGQALTFVEVNEEGTEAAAVTSIGMVRLTMAPQRNFSMIVDRPFFCADPDREPL